MEEIQLRFLRITRCEDVFQLFGESLAAYRGQFYLPEADAEVSHYI